MKNRYFISSYSLFLTLLLFASIAQAQDLYSNLALPTDSSFLSDRQYITDLLRKERYLNALATNIEIMTNEGRRFPVQYKFTPQEERDIITGIDKKIRSYADIDSLEKAYKFQTNRLDSSRNAYERLEKATPKKTKEELERDPTAKINANNLELARLEVLEAEELATETGKRLERLKAKVERAREAMEKYVLEGKKKLLILLRDYTRYNVQDFGYQGNNKPFYNFTDKNEYDRFIQYARFHSIAAEYKATRRFLLEILDANLKKRLFELELSTATKIYNKGDYGTALIYFSDIEESYKDIYGEIEDVVFLKAEASFGLGYYADARKLYEHLYTKYSGPDYAEMNYFEKTERELKKLESDLTAHKDSMVAVKKQYQSLISVAKSQPNNNQAGFSLRQINRQIEIIDDEISEVDTELIKLKRRYIETTSDKKNNDKAANIKVSKVAPYRQQVMHRILFMSYAYNDVKKFQADLERFKPYLKKDNDYSDKIRVLAATVDYRNKQFDSAIEHSRQVSDESPYKNDADYVKALAYLEMQNIDQAADAFGKVAFRSQGLFERGQNFIKSAAFLQLGNISYTKANRLMQEARKVLNSDSEGRRLADSTIQAEFKRYIRSKQASVYDRQLARILEKITAQDTVIEKLSMLLGSELLELSFSERDFQRLTYALQSKEEKITDAEKSVQKIQAEIDIIQAEGRIASDRMRRMRESLSRLQQEVTQARFDLYRKFALIEYARAEEYFESVDRSYPGKDIARVGTLWSKFRQNRQKEVELDIDQYSRTFRSSDNLYQAMFLSGYMKHIKDPTDADMIMKEYDFVYNGMMAFDFAEKFIEQKSILREQKTLTESVISTSSVPNEIQLGARLSLVQEDVLKLLVLDRAAIAKSTKSLLPDDRKVLLSNKLEELKLIRSVIPASSRNLASAADKTMNSVEKLLKMSVQTLSNETHLFAKHAPVLIAGEKADYQRGIDFYKKVARDEYIRSDKQAKSMQSGVVGNDLRKKLLNSYYLDNANLQKNQSNTVETILAQREFYGTRTIERAGTSAQYALTSLMYNEIHKSRTQVKNYERVVGSFRNSVKRKISQLEFYLNQIDQESTGNAEAPITRADLLQQEFNNIFGDFRKAFFIGTDHLKFSTSKEQKNMQVP